MSEFYKDWNKSLSINNDGTLPFSRLVDLTEKEREQACKNLNLASNDAIERLEGEFTDLRGDMAVVEGNVNTALTAVNNAVTSANDAVTAANAALSQVYTVTDDVDAISAKTDANSDNISVLSEKVDSNIANILSVSGKNTVQDNRLDVLDNKVAGLTNSVTYHDAKIQNLENDWTTYSADLRNDFNTFSAAEAAVIADATAAIPGQITAEVSEQLDGKQDKLTPGMNISLTDNVIDVRNNHCQAPGVYSVALGNATVANGNYSLSNGFSTSATGIYSHAEGRGTITDTNYQHVEGQFNAPANGALHVIGNGTSNDNRSNIVETFASGVNVNGNLIASGVNIIDQIKNIGDIVINYAYDAAKNAMIVSGPCTVNTAMAITDTRIGDNTLLNGRAYDGTNYYSINQDSTPVEILAWKGDQQRPLYHSINIRNNVSAWPSTLPSGIANLARFAEGNPYVTDLETQFTDLLPKLGTTYAVYMFQNCKNLTGNVVPYMDAARVQSSSRWKGMFRGCTGVDNYSTLTADPTYSAFF